MLKLLTYYFVQLAANNIVKKLKQFFFRNGKYTDQSNRVHSSRQRAFTSPAPDPDQRLVVALERPNLTHHISYMYDVKIYKQEIVQNISDQRSKYIL
jgi:hypothetical protein